MAIVVDSPEDSVSTLQPIAPAQQIELQVEYLFASSIWRTSAPQFLPKAADVLKENITKRKKEAPEVLKGVYPSIMTDNLHGDPRMTPLCEFIKKAAWTVLDNQGYLMDPYDMYFFDCFGQEHHKYGGHDTHTHPGGQITGFYFIEVPPDSSKPVFQDPRPGKVHAGLAERNISQATLASHEINYTPNAGDLFLTNSWLPHSFVHNANIRPFRFLHFTLGIMMKPTVSANIV